MKSFGGIGTEILMFRTPLEKEVARIDGLLLQVEHQRELFASTAASIRKFFDDDIIRFKGDLRKLSGATDFGRNLSSCLDLIAKGHEQLTRLKHLMSECRQAQDRAKLAMPDYTAFATNGRLDVPPTTRTFFLTSKNAGEDTTRPFEPSRQPDDPLASLAEIQLGRRFRE
jgi:hypothetical protein